MLRLYAIVCMLLLVAVIPHRQSHASSVSAVTPEILGTYTASADPNGIVVADGYVYLWDEATVEIVDARDPRLPVRVGTYTAPATVTSVAIRGTYAYVTTFGAGLRVVNIANPAAPAEVGAYTSLVNLNKVVLVGQYAIVGADRDGLRTIDVSNPSVPVEAGFITWRRESATQVVLTLEVDGRYAYVDTYNLRGGLIGRMLFVVDLSTPAQPVQVGVYDNDMDEGLLAAQNGLVYLNKQFGDVRFWVVDARVPTAPQQLGAFSSADRWFASSMAPGPLYLYVGASFPADDGVPLGLRIVSVANPMTPVEVGMVLTDRAIQHVALAGEYVYVVSGKDLIILTRGYSLPNRAYLPLQPVSAR